jgi:formyl-CoA transferase/CoA:oxalate CoA-transferase
MHMTGDPHGPPARVGVPIADIAGGIFACISVLGALAGRELHGGGRHVDVGMLDSLITLLAYDGLHFLNSGEPVARHGTAHASIVPWQAFPTSDGYIVVAAREDKFWRGLCDVVGRPELKDDPRTATGFARLGNREFVTSMLADAFIQRSKAEWVELFEQNDIPAGPVNDLAEVFADPQVQARGQVRTYEHPTLGPIRYNASPMQIAGWEMPSRPAPMLGQHTVEVLSERLGLDADTITALVRVGVTTTWPPPEDGEAMRDGGRPADAPPRGTAAVP